MNKNVNDIQKIAVFGSAFNPPHMGHADVIEQALTAFDRVIVVPSFAHAFGKNMAPYTQRIAMVEALKSLHTWGERVTISHIEQCIARSKAAGAPIYTFDVLTALQQAYTCSQLTFIVGPDNANPATWAKFYRHRDIDQQWNRWVAQERKAIRSTAIRQTLALGQRPSAYDCPPEIWQLYNAI